MRPERPYNKLLGLLAPVITKLAKRGDELSRREQILLLNEVLSAPMPHVPLGFNDVMSQEELSGEIIDTYLESFFIEVCLSSNGDIRNVMLRELDDFAAAVLKQKAQNMELAQEIEKHLEGHQETDTETDARINKLRSFFAFEYEFSAKISYLSRKLEGLPSVDLKKYPGVMRCIEDWRKKYSSPYGLRKDSLPVLVAATQQDDPEIFFRSLVEPIYVLGYPRYSYCMQELGQFIRRTNLSIVDAKNAFEKMKTGLSSNSYAFKFCDKLFADIQLVYEQLTPGGAETQGNEDSLLNKRREIFHSVLRGESRVLDLNYEGRIDRFDESLKQIKAFTLYHNLVVNRDYFFLPMPGRQIVIPAMGLFMMVLKEQDATFSGLFTELMKKFHYVSSLPVVDEIQKRSVEAFFPEYYQKILLLTDIMGASAFKWMSDELAQTVLPLERLLINLPNNLPNHVVCLLREYFEKISSLIMQRDNLKFWQNILVGIGAQCEIAKDLSREIDVESICASLVGEPREASNKINRELMRTVLSLMEIPPEIISKIDIQAVLDKITPHQFTLLIREKLSMKNSQNPFSAILDKLMVQFLSQQDVYAMLHEPETQIGHHNKNIQDKLRQAGIDPRMALQYDKKIEFSIGAQNATHKEKLASAEVALLSYLDQIKKSIPHESKLPADEKLRAQLKSVANSIDVIKDKKTPDKQKWDHIEKIRKNLDVLLKNQLVTVEDFRQFREFANHFLTQADIVQQVKNLPAAAAAAAESSSSPKKAETFIIQQWDKNRFDTLFLGNEVECCLAAGSAQFPAMLQRIMDDAMLFHVVTEKTTGKPIALSWLYLAEAEDGKIYVVANFLEIKAKYGTDEPSRKAIIDHLLRFTGGQYCRDNPGISGFLINELNYGWSKGRLSDLPVREIPLVDKMGGALLPSEHDDMESTSRATASVYYLASLQRQKLTFHEYPLLQLKHAAAAAALGVFADRGDGLDKLSGTQQPDDTNAPRG